MNNTTLQNSFKEFLISQDLAEISVKGYLMDIVFFQSWLSELHQNDVSLLDVSIDDLTAFRESMSKTKRQKPSAVNRRILVIKRFYNWTKKTGLISKNPAEYLKFIKRAAPKKPVALNKSEVHALLIAAGRSTRGLAKRNYAFIQLILQTGIRIGEVCKLEIRDLVIKDRSGFVKIADGKGRKYREIPLNTTARRALSEYLDTFDERKPNNFVFMSNRGSKAGIRTLQKVVSTIAARANIDRVHVTAH
ncbi:MAG TPA: tyrosine-type recombinase/integrase, partial [Victivallales bacterium]|nr:tyrosine-type recombinase/integrase [Victivallales bacterium]